MGSYIVKNQHKKQKSPSRWVVTIGSLRFEARGVRYGAKKREEVAANVIVNRKYTL